MTIAPRFLRATVGQLIGLLVTSLARWWAHDLEEAGRTQSLIDLLNTLSDYGILLFAVMVALAVIGIPIMSFVGVTGITVVALTVTLQQSLGSLAATVNLLLFKPLETGEAIKTKLCLPW